MNRDYSTLELVKHDKTAKAPERDFDATAIELDASALAPQVVPETTPQVCYSTSLPETHFKNEDSTKEHAPTFGIIKPRLKWLIVVMAFIIAVVITVGVSVGIWHHRQHSSHVILKDTSLAALILTNGDRQLFYQDNTGSFRRVARSASTNQWGTSTLLDPRCKARTLTPLAVTFIDDVNGFPPQVTLFYVSEDNVLSHCHRSIESVDGGNWTTDSTNYSTAVRTRSLVVTTTNPVAAVNTTASGSGTKSTTVYLLFYENPTGEASALWQRNPSIVGPDASKWVDITSQKVDSLPDEFRHRHGDEYSHTLHESEDAKFNAPFASRANFNDLITTPIGQSQFPTGALFYSRLNASVGTVFDLDITIGPSGPGNFARNSVDLYDFSVGKTKDLLNDRAIIDSDIALFGKDSALWINGTRPILIPTLEDPAASVPQSTFPFARLATVADNFTTYLYHQLNGNTFVEERWDYGNQAWDISEHIIVSNA